MKIQIANAKVVIPNAYHAIKALFYVPLAIEKKIEYYIINPAFVKKVIFKMQHLIANVIKSIVKILPRMRS